MIGTIDAIDPSLTNPQPDGTVTVTLRTQDVAGLKRDDGSPAQSGDVYSLQADGTWQSRRPGSNGPWECATVSGSRLLFFAQNDTHKSAAIMPLAV